MSNSEAASTLQLPIFSSIRWAIAPRQDCALCLAPSADVVCPDCAGQLRAVDVCCAVCGLPLPHPGLCSACRTRAPAFDATAARFEYRFPADRLIQRFKYAGDLALGRWLGQQLLDRVRGEPRPDLLVVPPLSAEGLRQRGFNQALELAKVIGRPLRARIDGQLVARSRDTAHQVHLGRRERRSNLRGAFSCTHPLRGERVAIVDDVMTTGATADAIARLLKRAGAGHVCAWVVARAPEPED